MYSLRWPVRFSPTLILRQAQHEGLILSLSKDEGRWEFIAGPGICH
jgi:hypothetical protein